MERSYCAGATALAVLCLLLSVPIISLDSGAGGTVETLAGGNSDAVLEFPSPGHYNTSASITLPPGVSVLDAGFDLQGRWVPYLDDPRVISTGSPPGNASIMPQIIEDGLGGRHLIWMECKYSGIYISESVLYYSHFNGTSWSEREKASPKVASTISVYPAIDVDGLGNLHLVFAERGDLFGLGSDMDIAYTMRDVSTGQWTPVAVLSTAAGDDWSLYPDIAADNDGNLHVAWQDNGNVSGCGTDNDTFYRHYVKGTDTWSGTGLLSGSANDGESLYPGVEVDAKGNAYVFWTESGNIDGSGSDFDIVYRTWDKTTQGWSTTQVCSSLSSGNSVDQALLMDGNDRLHVVWQDSSGHDGQGTDSDLVFRSWDTAVDIWSSLKVVNQGTDPANNSFYGELDVGSQGDVFVTWSEMNSWGTDSDVYLRVLDHDTKTWGDMIEIASGPDIAYRSVLSLDEFDRAHLAWTDSEDYQGNGNDYDVFLSNYGSLPQDVRLDIGGDGDAASGNADWDHPGILSEQVVVAGQWLVDALNQRVSDSDPAEIPIGIYSAQPGALRLSNIRITYTLNPLAPTNLTVKDNDDTHVVDHLPVLSWGFNDNDTEGQGAYQVQVGATEDAWGLWDSGEVKSEGMESVYNGDALLDGETYYWRVRTRDADGSLWGPWSAANFTMNSPPVVTGLQPTQGTYRVELPITFDGNDAQGDPVLFTVQVNYEGTWHTIADKTGLTGFTWTSPDIPTQNVDLRCRGFDGFENSPSWLNPVGTVYMPRNNRPEIELTSPTEAGALVNNTFNITWISNDRDGDPLIVDLFYTDDLLDPDINTSREIAANVTDRGFYIWDTTAVEEGDHKVLARIHDPWVSATAVSAGSVTVSHLSVDDIPPKKKTVFPLPDAVDVPVDTDITVTVTEALDLGTLVGKNIYVSDDRGNKLLSRITFTLQMSRGDPEYIIMIDPYSNLVDGTTYTVTVTSAVKDLAGNGFDGNEDGVSSGLWSDDYRWSFTTVTIPGGGDLAPPRVLSTTPEEGDTKVSTITEIKITFSEDMDQSTLNQSTLQLTAPDGRTITCQFRYDSQKQTITVKPSEELEASTTYAFTIFSDVSDLAGNMLDGNGNQTSEGSPADDHVFTFTTAAEEEGSTFLQSVIILLAMFLMIALVLSYVAFLFLRQKRFSEFETKDIFVIHKNGTLISHVSSAGTRLSKSKYSVSGMLTAIQDFVSESFREEGDDGEEPGGGTLNEIHHGKLRILIEHGDNAYMALVCSGEAPNRIRRKMRTTLKRIEKDNKKALTDWDGDENKVVGIVELLRPLLPQS